jgi:3-deoxy-D-manno-octulosonic-acid transferase
MYKDLDFCFMQTELDRERLLQIGIEPRKVKVTGNVKFDHDWPECRQGSAKARRELISFLRTRLGWQEAPIKVKVPLSLTCSDDSFSSFLS